MEFPEDPTNCPAKKTALFPTMRLRELDDFPIIVVQAGAIVEKVVALDGVTNVIPPPLAGDRDNCTSVLF